MAMPGKLRSAIGRICLLLVLALSAPVADAADDPAELLKRADDVKTSDHAQFLEIVHRLDADRQHLSAVQLTYLRYLKAYEMSYGGNYNAAVPELEAIARESTDVVLRFRADVTLTNILALSARFEEAYGHLNELLELQPKIEDRPTRLLGFGIAALLYNQAGQYDLAMANAERWLAEDGDGAACKANYLKVEALYRTGKLSADSSDAKMGLEACVRIGDPVYANLIRTFLANLAIDEKRQTAAIKLLLDNYVAIQKTGYNRLTSEADSILARAYLDSDDLDQAAQFGRSAVDKSVKDETTKPLVDAYQVLYQVAERRGDYQSALAYHEKYAVADKGYLGETSARALAFQMVNQHIQDKKRQLDELSEKNQLLLLQHTVSEKSEEAERLYILLLLLVIAFITLWTYRLKRSQLRFQRLARRDGLTGIVNRQHFMDEAKAMLQGCARAGREACLILVDLDNFKRVNDTHGHVAGDGVLKQTVEMFQLHMRAADLFGRLGGEEFGIMLADCSLETACTRAEELRTAIGSFARAGVTVTVSASFGVTSSGQCGHDLRQMLIHADSALYRAKRNGRNRVESFAPTLDTRSGAPPTLATWDISRTPAD
jgi:diguanylate cyclase (GGDEF)-like protein